MQYAPLLAASAPQRVPVYGSWYGISQLCQGSYCRPSCLAMKIHWALPTSVLLKRIRAEKAVLRPLLGIIFACAEVTQAEAACVTPVTTPTQLQGRVLHTRPPQATLTKHPDQNHHMSNCLHDDVCGRVRQPTT